MSTVVRVKKISPRKKYVKKSPREVKTFQELCGLESDNVSTRNYWMNVGENTVSLTKQRTGSSAEWKAWSIPKKDFNKLIDWYNSIQNTHKK